MGNAVIIGITGKNCAGKDSVADILEKAGFERHSLSDALRDEIKRRGREITRDELITIGNELRQKEGPGTLATRILRKVASSRAVIVSIRNPGEIEELRKRRGFLLVGVDAPVEIRFRRNVERNREHAPATLAQFIADETRENTAAPESQQLDACLAAADKVIVNDGTKEELERKINDILKGYVEQK